jgi:hypothetical protein
MLLVVMFKLLNNFTVKEEDIFRAKRSKDEKNAVESRKIRHSVGRECIIVLPLSTHSKAANNDHPRGPKTMEEKVDKVIF